MKKIVVFAFITMMISNAMAKSIWLIKDTQTSRILVVQEDKPARAVEMQDAQTRDAIWEEANKYANAWVRENCIGSDWFGKYTYNCMKNGSFKFPEFGHRVPPIGEGKVSFVLANAAGYTEWKIQSLAYNYQKQVHSNSVILCANKVESGKNPYSVLVYGLQSKGLWKIVRTIDFNNASDRNQALDVCKKNALNWDVVQNKSDSGAAYSHYASGFYAYNAQTEYKSEYQQEQSDALDIIASKLQSSIEAKNIPVKN